MTSTTFPTVSVVLPTYNRLSQLRRALGGLAEQVGVDRAMEIIVVSDGSSDGTDEWLRSSQVPVRVVPISQANTGAAGARNRGIEAAQGDVVLFIDDDVVPAPDLVATHLRHHDAHDDLVVIGPMNTPTDLKMSAWVRWEQKMLDKQYAAMDRGDWEATPRQFYTANASLARHHLQAAGGFDQRFRRAEDVELAYRLADNGLRFTFDPDASVLHYAERTFESWRSNATDYGRNDVIFGRDQGHAWLLDKVMSEFHYRHVLIRGVTRLSLRHPALRRLQTSMIAQVAQLTSRTGPVRIADASLSALYNLEYYHGVADEFGDVRELLARIDAAAQESA